MESCDRCDFWKRYRLTDNEKTHLAHLYDLLDLYKDRDQRVLFNASLSIKMNIDEYMRKELKGKCWRFPTHLDTYHNHYCGEFQNVATD